MTVNNGVEAVGKVQPGLEVKVLTSWDLGSDVGELFFFFFSFFFLFFFSPFFLLLLVNVGKCVGEGTC